MLAPTRTENQTTIVHNFIGRKKKKCVNTSKLFPFRFLTMLLWEVATSAAKDNNGGNAKQWLDRAES